MKSLILSGSFVRLEPLSEKHVDALARAAAANREQYRWSFVPDGYEAMAAYVQTAQRWRDAGTALPFATIRVSDDAVIGSTRFFDLERWAWPADHPRMRESHYDTCEIGYTWLSAPAIRTAANTEAKLLMLTHAFEEWNLASVCFHTDARNERSRAALERIGAQFEGILRAHRLASDLTPRNSARYSIVAAEWPDVRANLQKRLA